MAGIVKWLVAAGATWFLADAAKAVAELNAVGVDRVLLFMLLAILLRIGLEIEVRR